ncbi:zona pellucida protein AX 1 [Neosynchiropus ocellatus]
MAAVMVLSQARPKLKQEPQPGSGLKSDCLGNLMRLSLDKALAVGNQLEVEAINGTQSVVLTPNLAAQCGYSMESDPWGNTRIYSSLMGCYVGNRDDTTFNLGLRLHMYSESSPQVSSHDVPQTCSYSQWASREILCDRNYMEVSHLMPKLDSPADVKKPDDSKSNAIPGASDQETGIWKVTFYTPEPVVMVLKEAEQAGYGATVTPNRLVMRSPYNMAETYHEDVAGVPMEVFKVSTFYKTFQGMNVANMAAACPTGGVIFTEDVIAWHVPRRLTPVMDPGFSLREMHMGVNGQRLAQAQMSARGYTLSLTDFHFVIEIPVGSADGYNKSHAPDGQYHTSFSVEPMLEVLWREEGSREDARYKVLFPITTPLAPRPPQVYDYTDPENRLFMVYVGTFLHDVELRNITFSDGVLSVEESNAKGFLVQEQSHPGGLKSFSLQVPFDADNVLKHNPERLVTHYFLPLEFSFVIHPEETPFSQKVELEASLEDVVLPTLTGTCDDNLFYVTGKYGSGARDFQMMLGARLVTPDLRQRYRFYENATHFSVVVPYAAQDVVYESLSVESVRARLDLLLWEPNNKWPITDLFLTCHFPMTTTKCFSNGTVSAVAVKVESVPNLVPSWLTLRDKSCGPVFSNDHFAQFSFSVDSCGTTRTFFDQYMLYENEIGLHYGEGVAYTSPIDPEYRQTVSCYYTVNDTQSIGFSYKPQSTQPAAEIGTGQFVVQMRLAHDSAYDAFYRAEDYPVVKYLREPIFFEVELMQSDQNLVLVLENCWATLYEDRTSVPSWDLIVNRCENQDDGYVTRFHPVAADSRIGIPSHAKRFSFNMFTFAKDGEVLQSQIHVHCDAAVCDPGSQSDCSSRCQTPASHPSAFQAAKGQHRGRRSAGHQLSSGPILLRAQ